MHKILYLILFAVAPASEVMAKQDYTYVQSSLAFPWFIFFVIFALISIPFSLVVVLAWKERGDSGNETTDDNNRPSSSSKMGDGNGVFNRIVLPSILVFVGVFFVLLVLNAYEAMDLMEQYGTAAPTLLNSRP